MHPQNGFDRPGWLRCEQFGAGMITGWGAHHVDSAHWGMNTEYTGPVEVWGTAEFPRHGLWDVHGKFLTHAIYANGVTMDISGDFPNGIKFYGTKGWIFVSRGNEADDAERPGGQAEGCDQRWHRAIRRSFKSEIGPDEIHLYVSKDQHGNWLDCIRSRQAADFAGGDGSSGLLDLPDTPHCDEDETQTAMGPAERAISGRR